MQGDPLAMAMFALATIPLISILLEERCKQTWFADDAASGGTLINLRSWWDTLVERGPSFGYYPNPLKTYLMVKPDKRDLAEKIFKGTKAQITSEGRRYLGGALGSQTFVETFMAN